MGAQGSPGRQSGLVVLPGSQRHLAESAEFAGHSAFVEKPYLSVEVALAVRELLNERPQRVEVD